MEEPLNSQVAQSLHDESIQVLAAVVLRLGILKNRLKDASEDEFSQMAQDAEDGVVRALESIRAAMERLRSAD
jgi:signal transduction histidine kinase